MAYNFPNSPSNGATVTISNVTYTYNSTAGAWKTTAAGGAGGGASVQESAPSSPSSGNLWFDPSTLETYIYYNDGDSNQWVQSNPAASSAGTTVYSSIDDLPLSGVETGAQAFVSSTSRLYLWTGSGWYNIALINTTPSISGASSAYTLATDGSATTVTITATDPEGIPITYSIASDTSGDIATVSQGTGSNTNVFTITPSTNTANAGTFSLTFRASDGVNIATAASSFTLLFTVENSNYTRALITSVGANNAVNNSFDDASTNNHTITANGNVTQGTFSPYRHGGYSTYFDGTGDYLSCGALGHNVNSGQNTIEMWIYPTNVSSNEPALFEFYTDDGNNFRLQIYTGGGYSGDLRLLTRSGSGSNNIETAGASVVSANSWQHIACVRNSSNYWDVYVDGTKVITGSFVHSFDTTNVDFRIGKVEYGTDRYFEGYMSDVRIVTGTAVYTSAFTPPDERLSAITNTSLLTCHLPYIADGSTNSHSITVNGNTKTEPFSPFDHNGYSSSSNGGSMYFDGTGDYLTASLTSDFNVGTNSFTVEFWAYLNATGQFHEPFGVGTDSSNGFVVDIHSGNYVRLIAHIGGTWTSLISGSTTLSANQWYHIAIVRDGNDFDIYLNGTSDATTVTNSGSITNPSGGNQVSVGGYQLASTAWRYFNGYMSDLRFVNGTAVYTSDFTPSTAPLTAITNSSLLLNGTNAGIIDKSQSVKTITLNGDVKSSTTQTKYLSSSMYFDGTGDYLTTPASNDFYLDGQFTWECWVHCGSSYFRQRQRLLTPAVSSATGSAYISIGNDLGINGGAQSGVFCCTYSVSVNPFLYANVNGTNTGTAVTVPLNQWCHLAITRDSNNDVEMWQDGVLVASGSYSGAFDFNRSVGARIGGSGWSTEDFGGHMSDVRITKGLARYTSSFTAPTAALQG